MERKPIVLIVDDDVSLLFVAGKQMTFVGLDYETASNGAEAVLKSAHGYDLIFMDLGMTVLDGVEATVQIREIEKAENRTRTKIIGLTAFGEQEKEQCLSVGMDDLITKATASRQIERDSGSSKACMYQCETLCGIITESFSLLSK